MAAPRDNMDEEMMDNINTGTQFADSDQQDVDDESQYLALENMQENIVQENTGELYIFIYIFEYYTRKYCARKYWRAIYIYIYI